MKINRENIDHSNAIIRLVVEKSDYEKNVADKLREYRQQVSLPGFRPGKVPAGIIQKRFGKAILAEEVNQLLTQNLTNYLRDEKINLIGDPLPNNALQPEIDFDKDVDFEFVFDIAISPEINMEVDSTQTVDYYKIVVDDKMLEENIDQIRSQYGKNTDTDVVTMDAYIRADFAELDAEGNEIPDGIHAENVLLAMDRIKDKETLSHLEGKSPGDAVVMNPVTAIGDRHEVGHMLNISQEAAENLESNFRFTVRSIQVFEKADLNEELYKKLFGEETEVTTHEQFVEKLKENIGTSLENNSKQRFEVDARKALISKAALILPEAFLKRWLKETNKELTPETIDEEFDGFSEDLKWQLIRNNIINRHEIKVSEEETLDMAKSVALSQYQQYGIYNVADEHLETFANRILEKEEDRERIVRRIFEVKVFDFIRENVTLNEKHVTADEFRALYE